MTTETMASSAAFSGGGGNGATAAAVVPSSSPASAVAYGDVRTGRSDWRTYRSLALPNGATLILVRDSQSRHLAASCAVAAGASSDPRTLPGLAHFCEHMCFLGSKAHPGENDYKSYLAKHGGKSNASTSMTHTTYQFDVLADAAEPALDMFANFFVGPLFTESGTGREVNAVDSENSKNLTSDLRRRLQVLKSLADGEHHYSKFSTGNALTLPAAAAADTSNGDTDGKHDGVEDGPSPSRSAKLVRAALLAFHERHYRPRNMTAVVVGPQSLDELERWAAPRFGAIPDRWAGQVAENSGAVEEMKGECEKGGRDDDDDEWKEIMREATRIVDDAAADAPDAAYRGAESSSLKPPIFKQAFRPELQGGWPVVLTTLPLRAMRKLVLLFPLPPRSWSDPDRNPGRVISHLLGHEGPGSAFAVLQDAGLVSGLMSGDRISAPDQSLFQIDMSLTEEGERRWRDVAGTIFDYGRLIKSAAEAAVKNSSAGNGDTGDGEGEWDDDLRRIWDEVARLERMRFDQTSPGQVYSFASALARSASKYGPERCISIGSLLDEGGGTLPAEEVLEFATLIAPGNCIVEKCSKGAWEEAEAFHAKGDGKEAAYGKKTEKWYGVDYYLSPIEDVDVRQWGGSDDDGNAGRETPIGALHLPGPNAYIPRSLDLCAELPEEAKRPRIEKTIDPPKLVVNRKGVGRLWHRLDDRYALPKASLKILIRTATAENKMEDEISNDGDDEGRASSSWEYDPETAMRSLILSGVFSDALAQETYDAHLAGASWSLGKSSAGFTLTCDGYSDRLADLALKLLKDFFPTNGRYGSGDEGGVGGGSFLREPHFTNTKDRVVRSLKSFFESRRADSQAMYYRDLLMSSKGGGAEKLLEVAEFVTFDDVARQHRNVLLDDGVSLECHFTGNVSESDAKELFEKAVGIIKGGCSNETAAASNYERCDQWIPGPFERRLQPGQDIELHFPSKNPKEENGAVLVTYQSQIHGFKGDALSSDESLRYSAAIRLICKMMREPLFDELRTKQQLGYIVSSYHDINFASRQNDVFESMSKLPGASSPPSPLTTPIDSIVINVLSKKEKPTEVALRIDEFLAGFRGYLSALPTSEIRNHSDSLAEVLTKPIRKLGTEAGSHFAKIRRYAPEILHGADGVEGTTPMDLPWKSVETLAAAIRTLEREDLLAVWDSVVERKESRSKIVSCVYGSTFPIDANVKVCPPTSLIIPRRVTLIKSFEELMSKRKELIACDPYLSYKKNWSLLGTLGKHKTIGLAAAAAVVGIGVLGIAMVKGNEGEKKVKQR